MTALTDRTLPAPWGVCDSCGEAAGLPLPNRAGEVYCPACSARAVLIDTAGQSLEAAVSPVLGAWAAHWTAAGLPELELTALLDTLSGATYRETYRAPYVRAHLRRLRRAHGIPTFERQAPDRAELTAAEAPTLTAYHWADLKNPRDGHSWPYFTDRTGQTHTLPAGRDALTVILPGGDALLVFTGRSGQTDLSRREMYRVPAHLLPQVRAALSGEVEL